MAETNELINFLNYVFTVTYSNNDDSRRYWKFDIKHFKMHSIAEYREIVWAFENRFNNKK